MRLLVDGRRASSIDGLNIGFAEKLAAWPAPVGCCDCGGASPAGSVLTRIDRNVGRAGFGLGLSAWRRCGWCVELRQHGVGALARDCLAAHGLGPAEHAPVRVISDAMQLCGVPYWHATAPVREEFASPVDRWCFPEAAGWATRFRGFVADQLSRGA